MQFTTVIAIDREHLEEFRIVWPTWRTRPEIMANPLLIVADDWVSRFADLSFVDHPARRLLNCGTAPAGWSQREFMLTQFIAFRTLDCIHTPYMLKLDTDCVATVGGHWVDDAWFAESPAMVAPPWGYTKPASMLDDFDEWAARNMLSGELLERTVSGRIARHARIISYCCFVKVSFSQKAWCFALTSCSREGRDVCRMPIPSHDTYLFCLARRLNCEVQTFNARRAGWRHVNGLHRLRAAADEFLGATTP